MKTRRGRIATAMAAVAVSAAVAGGVYAAGGTPEGAGARAGQAGREQGRRAARERAAGEDDHRGEAPAGAAALRRPDHRRPTPKAGVGGVFSLVDPAADQPASSTSPSSSRGSGSRSCSPTTRSTATARSSRSRWPPAARSTRRRRRRTHRIGARESAAVGLKQIYSPMVDVSHEPRWGRISEAAGEDPYLELRDGRRAREGRPGPRLRGAPTRSSRASSTTPPTASPRAGATTTRPTCPSSGCATSTCRRSRPRSTPARTR